GTYLVIGSVSFAGNATGVRIAALYKNDSAAAGAQVNSADNEICRQTMPGATSAARNAVQVSSILELVSGDEISLAAFQNSGGSLALNVGQSATSGEPETFLTAVKIAGNL